MRPTYGFALAFCLAAFCGADIVTLKDGRKVEGEILQDDGKVLKIKMKSGAMTIDHKDVASIEKKLTPGQEYNERVKKLDVKSASAQLELASWASGKELDAEAVKHGLAAWDLDNALKGIGAVLEKHDYHLQDNRWLSPDEYYPSKGYIKLDSRWYHPLEHAWRMKLKDVDRLNGALNAQKESAKSGRGRVGRINAQISAEEAKIEKLEKDMVRAEADAENAKSKVAAAKKKLAAVEADTPDSGSSSNKADHARRVEAAKKNVQKEEKGVDAAWARKDDARAAIPTVQARINELALERSEAEQACAPLDEAVAQATRDLDAAKAEAARAKLEWDNFNTRK